MSYALATDGFVGADYQAATRGYIDLGGLSGDRRFVPEIVGRPPAFVSVLADQPGETVVSVSVTPALVPPLPPPSPQVGAAPIVTVSAGPPVGQAIATITITPLDGDD